MCLPVEDFGGESPIWKKSKNQVTTSKKLKKSMKFHGAFTFSLNLTKRLKKKKLCNIELIYLSENVSVTA